MTSLPPFFSLSAEVIRAMALNLPLVALESTVITHGLPAPQNLNLAKNMEAEVRAHGAVPATVGVIDGTVCIGLNGAQLERLAEGRGGMVKISTRDFAPAVAQGLSGGTTVAGTMVAASTAGIRVFATGGIGGVHRQLPHETRFAMDISTDLTILAQVPMIVVCAGAKAILDLPATLEYLETAGVPVVGFQTDDFPAFYSRSSGLPTSATAETPGDIAHLARLHWELGFHSAILVANPPPVESALSNEVVEKAVEQAMHEAHAANIHGQQVTPFLLERVSELTHGSSLAANLDLLLNNARLAADVARQMLVGKNWNPE
jgi:pseudouridine-5'-phosphate glycosidase